MCKKGIDITPKFAGMPRTTNCMFPTNHESVVAQVANGLARKKVRKVMQFATILHLLQ
jgi:hypothetical protein